MNLTKFKSTFPLLAFLVSGTFVSARVKHPATGQLPPQNRPTHVEFIENKGQWVPEAKFMANINGGVMFLTDKGFVYHYISQPDMERIHEMTDKNVDVSNEMVHHHAYRVNFVGANTSNVSYNKEDKSEAYNNYFIGNDKSKWASNVGKFGTVKEPNVYPGVNLSVYGKGLAPEYDFLVQPDADPSVIKLSFDGVKPTLDKEGNLVIKTSVNEVKEKAPYAYQTIGGKEVAVKAKYIIDNKGNIGFEFPEGYNKSIELVIDPVLVFATYSGGTNGGGGGYYSFCTTYDAFGNTYAGSQAYNAGWPTTFNAYQGAYVGGQDVGINKYNATGTGLIYSTYYGGTGQDLPHSLLVNSSNELIIAGSTTSFNLGMVNAFDSTMNGGTDIFVAHLNVGGTALIGSTYLGGNNTEPVTFSLTGTGFGLTSQNTTSPIELLTETNGDIWVVSSTSSADFPVTTNAAQSTYAGGATDGVIVRLNATCTSLLYSSFIGGVNADGVVTIQHNSAGNVVVAGTTTSLDFPTTTGALHTAYLGGSTDGFVSVINKTTGAIMNSTYVGTDANDNAVSVQVDEADHVYVLGITSGNYPISTGTYNVSNGNTFIDELNPTLSSSIISTRLGANNYFPTAFLVDICHHVYVCGLGASQNMPLTQDAFSSDDTKNFWFGVLEPGLTGLYYASYFGEEDHTHVGKNRLDPQGIIYHSVCNVFTDPFEYTLPPYTANAFAPNNLAGGQDIASFKFNFEATGVSSNFSLDPAVSGNDSGCAPYSVHFINSSTAATHYTWNFGDGSPTVTTAAPTHIYTVPGTYTVSLHSNNDTACITDDTAYMTITVLQTTPPIISVRDTTLCSFQQTLNISVDIANPSPNNTIQWGPPAGIVGLSTIPQITVTPSTNAVYYVIVKDTIPGICGFSTSDTVHINLRPRILDIVNNDTVVCEGTVIPITAVGTPGYTYKWNPAIGVSDSTALSPNITVYQPNFYTLTGSYPGCVDTSVTINIGMQYIPHLTISEDLSICAGTDVALESNVTPFRNDYIYQWTPTTPNLTNPNGPNTHFIADTSITYYLSVKTPIGCSDADTVNVNVFPLGFGGVTSDTGYCPGINAFAQLVATGGNSYSWSPAYGLSDTGIANPIATPAQTTAYTVLIRNAHNCLDTEHVSVQVYPSAQLTIPDSVDIYSGEVYQVQPNTNCLYFAWFPPSGLDNPNVSDPHMSPQVRTRYFVTASTEHGCVIKDSMDVLVKETVIDMPNAFKPNGINNLFKPAHRGIAQLNSFNIFNRWGNKVYSSTNLDEGWDGTYNGKPQPLGVYVYVIDAVTDSGKQFTKQGTVTLLR